MLGHPDNAVILRNSKSSLCLKPGGAGGLKRRVRGSGTVRGASLNVTYSNIIDPGALLLGDGASLEPSVDPSNNPIGKITVMGTALTTHTNAQLRLSVSATTNDVIAVSATSAFTFTGRVVLEPLSDDIPAGKSWPLMTVAASATAFTFSPSAVPPGYSFSTTGNASAGWLVTATKLSDTAAPIVENRPVTLIGDTYATLRAEVLGLLPDGQADLRAYYGTADAGTNAADWSLSAAYPAAAAQPGAYALAVSNLALNATYFVRHALSNSAGEHLSLDVASFATRPWDTPDTFTWAATNAPWFAESAWSHDTPYARAVPQVAGDAAVVDAVSTYAAQAGVDKTLLLTQDAALGSLTVRNGYGRTVSVNATNGPATLVFDAGPGRTNLWDSPGQLNTFQFGSSLSNSALTIEFRRPTLFRRSSAWTLTFLSYARWAGGSAESPSDILLCTTGDEYCQMDVYLLNTNNTFRGDLCVGDTLPYSSSTRLVVGYGATAGQDAMLGDAANQIRLRNKATLHYISGDAAPAVLARRVSGSGAVTASKALHLSAAAVLTPAARSGPGVGTLAVAAAALTSDPAARFELRLSSTNGVSDRLAFTVGAPLTLSGHLDLTPLDDGPAAAAPAWPVITVATNAPSFTCSLTRTPGYRLTTAGDASSGWTVTAQRVASGTLLAIF